MDNLVMKERALNIDKSTWKLTRLGELAEDISIRVDNPAKSKYDRFVGLEDFITGDLKITKWSTTQNLTSSAKAFQKGDILFARRNAYLRRASLVEFDGCCSGDAFVIRENHDKIVPGFLAFLMNSNALWDFANSNAAGTMSKRVKWRDLEDYQFLLPPKDQQAKLAELLWAMDAVVEKEMGVLERLEMSKKSIFQNSIYIPSDQFDNYFGRYQSTYDVKKLGTLLTEVQYGISESLDDKGGIPILRMNNLQNGRLDTKDLKYYTPLNKELEKFILNKGDVLFNRTNSYELVGKVSLFNVEGTYSFASYLIRLKTATNRLDSRFLNFYLNSPVGLAKIRKYRTPGVSQSNINAQNIKNVPIPLPPLKAQNQIMDKIDAIQGNEDSLRSQITTSKSLQKSLINQIF